MFLLHLVTAIGLWAVVAALTGHAYMTSVAAATFDARHTWAVLWCLPPFAVGHLVGWWGWTRRDVRFGHARHALALLVLALSIDALSHVAAHTSITVLREGIPPRFGLLYPLLALAAPLLLRSSARSLDVAQQGLVLAIAATTLSGAPFLLNGSAAWCLGAVALLLQLGRGNWRLSQPVLATTAAVFLVLLSVSTALGRNRLHAQPSWCWAMALAAIGLAVALQARDGLAWRRLLATPVSVAVGIASLGALLTVWLALEIHPAPAIRTRLVLFQQHPNFLAPFFGFHAVLALGLGLSARRRRALYVASAVLLAVSTVLTHSRTGMAAMLAGLLALPLLYGLRSAVRRARFRSLALVAGGLLALVAAAFALDLPSRLGALASGLSRFEKSVDYRADAWRNSLQIIDENRWLGIGPGTFISVARFEPGSRFFNEPTSPHPHNLFLNVAQCAGLPALGVFVLWLALLVRRFWRDFRADDAARGSVLPATLLCGIAVLLLANLLDLGLSLDSVLPAPLFLLTGLALSRRGAGHLPVKPVRPATAAGWALLLAGLLLVFGVNPVRAQTRLEQAQLWSFEAGQRGGDEDLMQRARDALRVALSLDPVAPRAHEHLSRWLEAVPDGFLEARNVLEDLVRQAPHYGPSRSLLGHLYMRAGLFEEAAAELERAISNAHGSVHLSRDRADRVTCLARVGRRDEALDALVEALSLDKGVIGYIPWSRDASGARFLPLGGDIEQQPIDLVGTIQILFTRHVAQREAGRPVGRRSWMETYSAFRDAGRDDMAAIMLDYLWDHVPEVERPTIVSERAALAHDAGDFERAAQLYAKAFELSGLPFFQEREAMARRALGSAAAAEQRTQAALPDMIEILDQPLAFRNALTGLSDSALLQGQPARAAAWLERSALFEDDILERARLFQRVGQLYLLGDDSASARRALVTSLDHIAAKPWPADLLVLDLTDTLPGRIATSLCAAWRADGLTPEQMLRQAWELPWFFRSDTGPALFRLGLFAQIGRVDKLFRESELLLLSQPGHTPALWARLAALEGLGRHADAARAMRTLAEHYATDGFARRAWDTLVADLQSGRRPSDRQAWWEVAVLQLLRGQYAEAAGAFAQVRAMVKDSPLGEARVAGWQARAALFAGRTDEARQALSEALALDPHSGLLRLRLETLP